MAIDFDFYPITELPRQRALLQVLVPGLAALERTDGVWLTGSLARGDADRWSSVDLHLLWDPKGPEQAASSGPFREILKSICETLGEENVFIEQIGDAEGRGSIRGITTGVPSKIETPDKIGSACLPFELSWAPSTDAKDAESLTGARRLLYIAQYLDGAQSAAMTNAQTTIEIDDTGLIERQLGRFWLLLARLPAAVRRREQLAAHMLLTEMHALLIDLVVALNGGSQLQTRSRINQYLGPAQREAFERSLGLRQSGRQKWAGGGEKYIGQAVALVVLYRWYAPQLVEKHSLTYPQMAEDMVLALLNAELEDWPASISTG